MVSIDTLQIFQAMTGWEAVAQAGQGQPGFGGWQSQLMDDAVNDLGINRIRLEVRSGAENPVDYYGQLRAGQISEATFKLHRYDPVNDNGDPLSINPSGFHFTEVDEAVAAIIIPMRQRLAARGEALYVNTTYVGPASFHASVPAEYAEFMLALFQHLQATFGFTPDAIELDLEPDNNTTNPWTATQLGQVAVATGDRLAAAGFTPALIAPAVVNMSAAVTWFDQAWAVPGAPAYLKELSYHRYRGVSSTALAGIAARANALGVRTAMLEHIGSGVEDLYQDLVVGHASAWQQFALAFPGTTDDGGVYYLIQGGRPVLGSRTPGLRQYFRYVRLGARRVGAISDTPRVRPVAFINPSTGMVVVLHLDQPEQLAIRGLRPGRYGMSAAAAAGSELGQLTVGSDGELRLGSPVSGVITVYSVP